MKETKSSEGLFSSKWKIRGLLIAIVFLAYANSFSLGAAVDGEVILHNDARIRSVTTENLKLILDKPYGWPQSSDWLYRPITTLSFLFNYAVLGNGQDPAGYHVANFLLHGINVWLVFELGLLLFQSIAPAFFAAALWGVHPIGVESVANLAGRADLLAAGAVLGALVLYIRSAETTGRGRYISVGLLFVLCVVGVFSKENAAGLIGLMLLWDLMFGQFSRRVIPAYSAAAVSLVLWLVARWEVFRALPLPPVNVVDNPLLAAGFWTSRLAAVKIVAAELWLLIWPASLTSDRSYRVFPIPGAGDPLAWFALVLIATLLIILILRFRRDRLLFWSAGFVGIALLPTSNLVMRIGAAMAERFLYLPAVGFAIAVVALAWRLKSQRNAMIVIAIAVALCAGRAFARNPAWNDNFTLASTDAQTSPDSFRLHGILGQYLYSRNPRNNLDRAIRELETAWEILKPLPDAENLETAPAAVGMYYGIKGDREGGATSASGREWYEKSLAMLVTAKRLSVAFQDAYDQLQRRNGRALPPLVGFELLDLNLGQAYARLGRLSEAIECYRRARIRQPEHPLAYEALGKAYADDGDWGRSAIAADERCLASGLSPSAITAIQGAYAHLPAGECAVNTLGQLNSGCSPLRRDMCTAAADLEQVFAEGRKPDGFRPVWEVAIREFGCPAKR